MMMYFLLMLSIIWSGDMISNDPSLLIEISNLKNNKGQICVLVFIEENGYPEEFEKAYLQKIVPASTNPMTIEIDGLSEGDYVVTVLHDENGNDSMDKNMFGKPLEGYGISNNPKPKMFGPPDFKKGLFRLNNQNQQIDISVRY